MYFYIENLRGWAIMAVVMIHVSASLLYLNPTNSYWMIGHFFDTLSRWSVPIFIMISGALLLRKEEPLMSFYKKRLYKIIVPFLFWIVFYLFWGSYNSNQPISITSSIKTIYTGPVYYHLWYLYMLIGLYLFTPFLRRFVQHATNKELLLFIVFSFSLETITSLAQEYLGLTTMLEVQYFIGYIGFYLLGYYLSFKMQTLIQRKIFYTLGLLGVAVTFSGTWILSNMNGELDSWFYRYLSPSTIMISIMVFIFVKHNMNNNASNILTKYISKYSFGIYLVHPFFLDILPVSAKWVHPFVGIPLTWLLCMLMSLFFCILVSRINWIRII
ncbi:MAG TPA: acyltransferase family protein [Metabacillus sp.]|nr:acyltransferase family protein [Metabacillus sp.]